MTMPKPSRSMNTTRKTIVKADLPERLGAGETGEAGEAGCIWIEESGMVDIPADRSVRGALRANGQNSLPPYGGGLGWGVSTMQTRSSTPPHPNPPPQGGREKSASP